MSPAQRQPHPSVPEPGDDPDVGLPEASFVLLAGGGSRRMGVDKALAEVGGVPMARRVMEAGTGVCSDAVLVAGEPGRYRGALGPLAARVRLVEDRVPGLGPLAGVEAGLSAARRALCFVAACDLPFLPSFLVRGLLQELAAHGSGGRDSGPSAVVPLAEGRPQPLAAAYTSDAAAVAAQCVREERLSTRDLLERLDVRTVELHRVPPPAGRRPPPGGWLFNVNRPDQLVMARRWAGGP